MSKQLKTPDLSRRNLLVVGGAVSVGVAATPAAWKTPIINQVMIPAHAQTSMCVADTSVGGPLAGHPSGALTCEAACEAEATALNGQLCSFSETIDGSGATQCGCEIDT